jgi:UDP-2-acetamido-2,6-beta-L-arabino-hexul-4-ose reductase
MRTVGITGSRGLIGWHFSCFLAAQKGITLKRAHREEFENPALLRAFVESCDAIVHCAGMNRGEPATVSEANIRLTQTLVEALESANVRPHVLFTNSTHIDRPTAYGESKRVCAAVLQKWAESHEAKFLDLVLPGVFGESGKPFYNSVVSTFCYQIANGEKAEVHNDVEIELIHALQVSEALWAAIETGQTGQVRVQGKRMTTSALLAQITQFHQSYQNMIVPDLREGFDLGLFNTLRSYLFPQKYPVNLLLREDARGSLFEVEKNRNGGQAFVSTTVPGITRGNHFHLKKIERFCVVQGKARIQIRKLFDDTIHSFEVEGSRPQYIDMPTLHTHNITNTGDGSLLTLFWSADIFDPNAPDTTALPIVREPQCP